jgi:hypothetical protein
MHFGPANAVNLGGAGTANACDNWRAVLIEPGNGVFDLSFGFTAYTISFHYVLSYKKGVR